VQKSGQKRPTGIGRRIEAKRVAVQFSDGSNEAFLRRLWRDLYGDEP